MVKVPQPSGGARYQKGGRQPWDRAISIGNLRAFLREILTSGNLLVLKTRVGGAQPVGLALDRLAVPGLIGTIAGDDTVLAVLAEDHEARDTIQAIWTLIEENKEEEPS